MEEVRIENDDSNIRLAPGIYHDIKVVHASQQEIKAVAGPGDDESTFYGFWDEGANTIYINKDMDQHRKRHTFYHEIAHHVLEELSEIGDEETRCNVLGAFFMKLLDCDRGKI